MAVSCVRVHFDIGHEASIRNKRTPDGFTHDWEVFVRGGDNAEIHHFVDKVVFHLHETFPKPKRTVKEPPYVVKESGYAGFNLPIDIYLKTREEGCRKIRFYYDLTLQPLGTGSARISNVVREKSDFLNPIEDFRRKLIKGGGVGVGSDGTTTEKPSLNNSSNNSNHVDDAGRSSPHSASSSTSAKGKSAERRHKPPKEVKPEETRLTNSFAELFGTPIKTVKTPKAEAKPPKEVTVPSGKAVKQSLAKERKEAERKEAERGGGGKERPLKEPHKPDVPDKPKDKSRKSGSSSSSSSLFTSTKEVVKTEEKPKREEVKEKPKNDVKAEKKHDDKKVREEKRDKHNKREHEKREEKPPIVTTEKKEEVKKEVKEIVGKHRPDKEEKKVKSTEKVKGGADAEKTKHKHKKKDKHRKEDEREKKKGKEGVAEGVTGKSGRSGGGALTAAGVLPKEKSPSPPPPAPPPPPPQPAPAPVMPTGKPSSNPLNQLLAELSDKDSDSEFSGSEEPPKLQVKAEPPERSPPQRQPPSSPPPPLPAVKIKEEKRPEPAAERVKKRDRKFKDEEHRKRKRKHKDREEPIEKAAKTAPEAVVVVKEEKPSPDRLQDESNDGPRSPSPEDTLFTEEYINQLKDLQRKIMTLQDNADLQKVVQVISETGQFEITQRTFDFDLCALDPSTVKMLQDMFVPA